MKFIYFHDSLNDFFYSSFFTFFLKYLLSRFLFFLFYFSFNQLYAILFNRIKLQFSQFREWVNWIVDFIHFFVSLLKSLTTILTTFLGNPLNRMHDKQIEKHLRLSINLINFVRTTFPHESGVLIYPPNSSFRAHLFIAVCVTILYKSKRSKWEKRKRTWKGVRDTDIPDSTSTSSLSERVVAV